MDKKNQESKAQYGTLTAKHDAHNDYAGSTAAAPGAADMTSSKSGMSGTAGMSNTAGTAGTSGTAGTATAGAAGTGRVSPDGAAAPQ